MVLRCCVWINSRIRVSKQGVTNSIPCSVAILASDWLPTVEDRHVSHLSRHQREILSYHYSDAIMSAMASQITSLTTVYGTVYSGADQRKHQSSASRAFVRGIHGGPVNSPHKWPVTRKMFPFDDVIMIERNVIGDVTVADPTAGQFLWRSDTVELRCVFTLITFDYVFALRPRQNGRHFADDTFNRISVNENVRIPIKLSLKFVPKGPINKIPALVQIMAWRRSGDKPLSEPMMVDLPMHICVIRPQWVKAVKTFGHEIHSL